MKLLPVKNITMLQIIYAKFTNFSNIVIEFTTSSIVTTRYFSLPGTLQPNTYLYMQ